MDATLVGSFTSTPQNRTDVSGFGWKVCTQRKVVVLPRLQTVISKNNKCYILRNEGAWSSDTSSFSKVSSWWTKVDFACRIRMCFIVLLDTSVS